MCSQVGVVHAPRGATSLRHVGPAAPPSLLHRGGRRHSLHHTQALPELEANRIRSTGNSMVSPCRTYDQSYKSIPLYRSWACIDREYSSFQNFLRQTVKKKPTILKNSNFKSLMNVILPQFRILIGILSSAPKIWKVYLNYCTKNLT